jgi:hypothetical protein
MKNGKMHLIIGTAVCAATMLMFLAFSSRLPDNVPIQITIDGFAGNTLPKPLFVFGMPVAFVAINLIRGLSLVKKENVATYSFYIIPGIAVLLSILTLVTALHMG